MRTAKELTNSVRIQLLHYKNKRLKRAGSVTVYDTTPPKVMALIKAAIQRGSNGK